MKIKIDKETKSTKINKPEIVSGIFQKILETEDVIDQDKEHFWVIGLNTRNIIKYIELVSLGTLNTSPVHPREIFRLAIYEAVNSIILVHNHPSEVTDPSENDIILTQQLVQAGEILGIGVLDHIIITKNQYLSFKEKGLIK